MKLSDFELDTMKLLWASEPCTVSDIHACFETDAEREKPVAYTTVKTIFDRLEKKGAIERSGVRGRAIVYQTCVSQQALSKQATPSFMERFFKGNSRSLIAHFIKEESLNDDDIEYLQTLLKNKKKGE